MLYLSLIIRETEFRLAEQTVASGVMFLKHTDFYEQL